MNDQLRKAAEMALEALEEISRANNAQVAPVYSGLAASAANDLRQALEQSDMSTKQQNIDTSSECVHSIDTRQAQQTKGASMTDRELMQKAFDLLSEAVEPTATQIQADIGMCAQWDVDAIECIESLRQALAQPEQEPVAWVKDGVLWNSDLPEKFTGCIYTAPSSKPWVSLTDEERVQAFVDAGLEIAYMDYDADMKISKVIEAKLKEKNT